MTPVQNLFNNYITSVTTKFLYEETSEMGYRTDFEILLKGIFESINVRRIDHDARATQGNKPDFVVLNHDIPILYIEAKNLGVSLDKVEKSEQMTRYFGYSNLVLTDYVEFRFYRNGIRYEEPIKIANYDIKNRILEPKPENYEFVAKTMLDFAQSHKEPIRSGGHLSKIMGGKAQRIRDNVRQFLSTDSEKNAELLKVYETFKELLVHDLTKESFADMYAQTLVYGLFAARYHDETEDNFSRQEARELIPKSNPFLREFFDHITGPNFDKRLEYIVDELCVVFSHANVPELMEEYFKGEKHESLKKGPDPIIHFYEDFLEEYDPILRKKMGAYYTPLPVVEFIVNSVDELLIKEFGLTRGLSDNSKNSDGKHRVQILDPAVGTGTFISAVIGKVYSEILKKGQKGSWPAYVQNDLLPRLHGFELMMTPYTIAHLKLSIAFEKTGFKYFNNKRLGIYLTNSLESNLGQMKFPTAFGLAESIAEESKEASKIKNDTPIMVVLGNPPYSSSSSNRGEWILNLIKDYKKDLHEQKINLDDDYIKFIRFAEHFIEKNKSGVVAMITNNSFIDGVTHRQMRKHLLETFDDIFILDLHGDAREAPPIGILDANVFDIQQGVSINIFVRKNIAKNGLGKINFFEVYGTREEKFKLLHEESISSIRWKKLDYSNPYYFFVSKDFVLEEEYLKGIRLDDIFQFYSSGIQTKNDKLAVQFEKKNLEEVISDFERLRESELKSKYGLEDSSGWNVKNAKADLMKYPYQFTRMLYRPFDIRETLYTSHSGGFIGRPREKLSRHFVNKSNIGLIANRQVVNNEYSHIGVTDKIICHGTFYLGNKGQDYLFPLFLYADDGVKYSNLNKEVINQIKKIVGKVPPEDMLDYIYSALHSPTYRDKYKEFLKIDFPRIPYPSDKKTFQKLVKLGCELRELHLLESPRLNNLTTIYPESGSDTVEKIEYRDERIYINPEQYFGNVPELAWNFWIGGYQPAQKWLKDRKGRTLTNQDIEHYQKMIVALVETDKIMKKIDMINSS